MSTVIDAKGVYYRQLNEQIRAAVAEGQTEFVLNNVNGQRYIADGLEGELSFLVNGTPGQDMAAFMRGPRIRVEGNAQDGVGNTMDDGKVVVNGMAGDVLGYAMRGGRLYIKGDVGYRVGIHMKAFMHKFPVIVIGGKAGDFLGEYMAGGAIVLLGLFSAKPNAPIAGRSIGTGMHGGAIYVRGAVPEEQLGPGLNSEPVDEADTQLLRDILVDYAAELGLDVQRLLEEKFTKIRPFSHRPYKNLYVGA
jgi:glutamate synthase domain-containing protein 3